MRESTLFAIRVTLEAIRVSLGSRSPSGLFVSPVSFSTLIGLTGQVLTYGLCLERQQHVQFACPTTAPSLGTFLLLLFYQKANNRRLSCGYFEVRLAETKVVLDPFCNGQSTARRDSISFPISFVNSLTSVKILNSIIFLGKATQYVKKKKDHEPIKVSQKNSATSANLQAQGSATLLDSAESSNVSLMGAREVTGTVSGESGQTKPRQKTLAEIDRYTLCNKEIVVF